MAPGQCDGEDYELLLAVGGTRAVPAVVGRGRTRISQVGVLRAMPLPTAPRVVCMLSDVELSLDGAAGFHDANRVFEAR